MGFRTACTNVVRARPVRLERTACGFEVRRSIQLSYGRFGVSEGTRTLDHWGHNPVLYPTELHSPHFYCESHLTIQINFDGRLTIFGALNYVEFRAAIHPMWCMARLRGFEPPTYGLEVRSSIHLSYRRSKTKYTTLLNFGQG